MNDLKAILLGLFVVAPTIFGIVYNPPPGGSGSGGAVTLDDAADAGSVTDQHITTGGYKDDANTVIDTTGSAIALGGGSAGANQIGTNCPDSSIYGGTANDLLWSSAAAILAGSSAWISNSNYSVVLGGRNHEIEKGSGNSILGGLSNIITNRGEDCVISGGNGNRMDGEGAIMYRSVISGGEDNTIFGGTYSVIAGGLDNIASNDYVFAAGRKANAVSQGAFVWADSTDAYYTDNGANTFNVEAAGGIWEGTNMIVKTGNVFAVKIYLNASDYLYTDGTDLIWSDN